jgi:hypothetical protein
MGIMSFVSWRARALGSSLIHGAFSWSVHRLPSLNPTLLWSVAFARDVTLTFGTCFTSSRVSMASAKTPPFSMVSRET